MVVLEITSVGDEIFQTVLTCQKKSGYDNNIYVVTSDRNYLCVRMIDQNRWPVAVKKHCLVEVLGGFSIRNYGKSKYGIY